MTARRPTTKIRRTRTVVSNPNSNQETVEKKEPIDNEFALDPTDDVEEDAPRVGRMNDLMQGLARQASLDPGDDLGL